MKSLENTEEKLKKITKLSVKLYEKAQNLVNQYLEEKNFLNKIKEISKSFRLKPDIKFDIIIVSAEMKYIFNYLSGGFVDEDSKKIAEKLSEFIYTTKFTDKIQYLSGRAIYDKNIVEKVICSLNELKKLGYSTKKGSFFSKMKSLCNKLFKTLENNKGIILLGISSTEKLTPFDKLLAHEIFHLILIGNGIWFQGIKKEYDYLDEGLANLLERRYSIRKKDIEAGFWEEILMIEKKSRINKIRNIYNDLKSGKLKSLCFLI